MSCMRLRGVWSSSYVNRDGSLEPINEIKPFDKTHTPADSMDRLVLDKNDLRDTRRVYCMVFHLIDAAETGCTNTNS